MKKLVIGLFLSSVYAGLMGACSPADIPVGTSPVETAQAEKPFYTVAKNGKGPLTMDELQVNIPDEIDKKLSDERRACHLQAIEDLAAKAGDPETLDPADVAYLPTDGTWEKLTRFDRRNILGQVIVSRAFAVC